MGDLLASSTDFLQGSQPCLARSYFTSLQAASISLQTLCISQNASQSSAVTTISEHALPMIGSMARLTKLHLTVGRGGQDFSRLGHLHCLKDLALLCGFEKSFCASVLESNTASLEHLKLGAPSWTEGTYKALGSLQNIQTVVLKLGRVTDAGAQKIAGLTRPHFVEVMITHCEHMSDSSLCELSKGDAHITRLRLHGLKRSQCLQLQPMQFLHTLILMHPDMYSDHNFCHVQPSLTCLRLIDCHDLTASEVANIDESLPVLQSFHFQQTPERVLQGCASFTLHGVLALLYAPKLSFIDLELKG